MSKKKVIIIAILFFIVLSGGFYAFGRITHTRNYATECVQAFYNMRMDKKMENNVKAIENTEKETSKEKEVKVDDNVEKFDEEEIIIIMHKMANTKIIADEKWGEIKVTDDRINRLKKIVDKSTYESKEKLMSILEKWGQGNFSEADKDHNFLWNKLGGTVGKAKGIIKSSGKVTGES